MGFRAAVAFLLIACAPPAPSYVASSSTIVVEDDGLWVTSPDDDSIVRVDRDDLSVLDTISIAGAPEQIARAGDAFVVTLSLATEIAIVRDRAVQRIAVPCGGTRAVVSDAGGNAFVT